MLWTDTHELSHVVHLIKEVDAIAVSITARLLDQSSQDRDSRGLSSAIMAQQSKDLTVIHLHVDASDRPEPTREGLLEVVDLEVVVCLLEPFADDWGRLIVVNRHLVRFKCVVVHAFSALHQPLSHAVLA